MAASRAVDISESLRVGVVGAGYFSRFHIEAWARMPGARLVAVADRDIAAAQTRIADEAGGVDPRPAAYTDAAAMLERERLELVDIVAPPSAHLELIRICLDAGARAIICQKPFCGDLARAERAVAAARAVGARIAVHENFRWQPWWRRIKRLIDDGALGRPLQVSFRFRPGDGRGPAAYLDRQPYFQTMPRLLIHETGVHFIDLFRYLLGPPTGVYADLRRLNPAIAGEDAGFLIFDYDDGRRALFDGDRLVDHPATNRRRTMGEALVEGDEAVVSLDGEGRVWLRRHGSDAWEAVETGATTDRFGDAFGGDCVFALQAHVVESLRGGGALENEAEDYLMVMRIAEAAYRSAELGARVALAPAPAAAAPL